MSTTATEYVPDRGEAGGSPPDPDSNGPLPPVARPLSDMARADYRDENELLRHRYLCRGAGLLLAGPTGVGKSSLTLQCLISWALGRPAFGLEPTGRLVSLLVEAEDDEGDLAERRDGEARGLGLSAADVAEATANVLVVREDSRTGLSFCREVLRPLLTEHRPDVLCIDPALAYLGGDASSQKDTGRFLRNLLNPLIREYDCGCIVITHTNKPPTGREKPNWQAGDLAYLGTGSAEWCNWARAVLALRSVGSHDVFELVAPKRGGRLGWKDADGNPAYQKFLAHSKEPGVICWREVSADEVPTKGRPKSYDVAEMLGLLPPEGLLAGEWQRLAKSDCGISEASFHRERRALEKAGRVMRSKVSGKWQPIKSA
jgi:hypothetical protein